MKTLSALKDSIRLCQLVLNMIFVRVIWRLKWLYGRLSRCHRILSWC